MRQCVLLYIVVITIPVFLGVNAWQASRYAGLEQELGRLKDAQTEWVESNKRLMAGIAVLSSSERIEHIAQNELGLEKIQPEDVLQIRIEGGGTGFDL
ncbi:MAG: cell division protein FtsL [Treponema sp.]|jgi:cell division protein FtsL|nr:cell division protein FtsL [Treponema sp.]